MREIQIELQREREVELNEKMHTQRKLRVYVDSANQKYYIDMAAAFALNLITYKQWTSSASNYYEITERQLDEYKRICEIVYEYFNVKKPETFAYSFNDSPYSDNNIHIDNDKIKTNSNKLNELKDLRDELVPKNIYNEIDYKDSNDFDQFIPKK